MTTQPLPTAARYTNITKVAPGLTYGYDVVLGQLVHMESVANPRPRTARNTLSIAIAEGRARAERARREAEAPAGVDHLTHPDGQPVDVCSARCAADLRDLAAEDRRHGRDTWVHPRGVCAFDGYALPTAAGATPAAGTDRKAA